MLTLFPAGRFGDLDGIGAIPGPGWSLDADADGRWYLASASHVTIFGPNGEAEVVFGRAGSGPGEYERITRARAHRGVLHVFDGGALRHTALSLPDGAVRHEARLPVRPFDAIVLDSAAAPSHAVISAIDADAARTPTLHFLRRSGDIVATQHFPVPAGTRSSMGRRRLLATDGRTVWTTSRSRYRIVELAPDGTVRRTLTRRAPWFPGTDAWTGYRMDGPPDPAVEAMAWAGGRTLLFVISVADPEWREGLARIEDEHGVRWVPSDPHDYWDSVIELVDMGSGRVLASARHDVRIGYIGTPELLASLHQDSLGVPRVAVWRVALPQAPERNPS